MKIAIIGYSGAGKSTLAKRIADVLGIEALPLDQTHFLPGWVERDPEESRELVRAELERQNWVIDGNYPSLLWNERLRDADQIVWLDYPRLRCLVRVIKRSRHFRGRVRESMAKGCVEKLDWEFVWWILYKGRTRTYRNYYREAIERYPEKAFILQNDRDLKRYFDWFRRGVIEQLSPAFDTQRGSNETLQAD